MAAEPESKWSPEELTSDDVSKKDIATFIQANASLQFLKDNKLKGQLKSIVKSTQKDKLVAAYTEMFETKAFKKEGEEEAEAAAEAAAAAVKEVTTKTEKLAVKDEGPVKYTKRLVKKGDKINFPKKGDTVGCFYKGTLDDGKVFDQNQTTAKRGKKPTPLKFKVGVGNVIKGWDMGIMTMSVGEKADFIIEPEWAYGKKGVDGKIPPNSRLNFEIELLLIE